MSDDNDNNEISFVSDPDESKIDSDRQTPVKTAADIKMSLWMKVFVFVGLVCTGQFFVCSLIGLFRGYSVQSLWPVWIMLGGVFILLGAKSNGTLICNYKAVKRSWMSYLVSFSLIYFSIIGILQGRFRNIGDDLFDKGEYSAAIGYYQKEIDTWYLRLKYNHNEDSSLFSVAESYCQMEDFDQARKTYLLVAERSKGYYKDRSTGEAVELDLELKNIANLQEQLAGEVADDDKADILFDIALAYRGIECNKKAKEQYAIIQTLDVREGFIENAKKFSAGLK